MNPKDRALVQELATGLLRDIKYRPEQKSKLGHHEVKELSLRLRDYEEALQAAERQAEEREKRYREALLAYRSALRCGERESETLERMAREALEGDTPA